MDALCTYSTDSLHLGGFPAYHHSLFQPGHQSGKIEHLHVEYHRHRSPASIGCTPHPPLRYLLHDSDVYLYQYRLAVYLVLLCTSGNRTPLSGCNKRHRTVCWNFPHCYGSQLYGNTLHHIGMAPDDRQNLDSRLGLPCHSMGFPFPNSTGNATISV